MNSVSAARCGGQLHSLLPSGKPFSQQLLTEELPVVHLQEKLPLSLFPPWTCMFDPLTAQLSAAGLHMADTLHSCSTPLPGSFCIFSGSGAIFYKAGDVKTGLLRLELNV